MSGNTDQEKTKNKGSESKSPRSGKCDMCLSTKKEIKTQCQKCDYFLCNGCNNSHKRIPACKDHQVKTLSEIMNSYRPRMRNTVNDLQQEKAKVEKSMGEISNSIDSVNQAAKKQKNEVNKLIESAIQDLKDHQKRCNKMIKEANEKTINQLANTHKSLEKSKNDLEDKISYIQDGMDSNDLTTVANVSKSLDGPIKEEVAKIKGNIPKVQSVTKSNVTVGRGQGWDPSKSAAVTVN